MFRVPLTQSRGLRADRRYQLPATLDRSVFRDWLQQHFYQVVGSSASEYACPLARWLSDLQGVPFEVQYGYAYAAGTKLYRALPSWAESFARSLDFTFAGAPVSGEQALLVLDSLDPHALPQCFLREVY